ncbi:cobalt-precorrin-5B (C(1))-methyltransferase CbiD [Faecalicatena contorta]|uniref:cobalt-precorrin-5B (C(1))-methyltransferase CbiD n=1 Tax=Faecalicatena contorta TaxID=39482 RepID=UPI001EEF5512|nr:cobalt-precorrin-5B (C(1))-methyltransferase CbiD [Faecalicatena contorta]MCF2682131.1 cobalamin biosynthesis protein CbiD [Faecalicatena contorta]
MTQKSLAKGYTTGTCAQAATKAAMWMLMTGKPCEKVQVELPQGETLSLDICEIKIENGEGVQPLPEEVCCAVKKDSGDDPDITNGVLVYSKVSRNQGTEITLDGGEGIGRVTKPGLDQPVGAAAINRVPRQMIIKEIKEVCEEVGYERGIHVEISIPEGERLAAGTFNPRLGIEGGLSILGTTGIVEPMSEQALVDTIRVEMKVCMAGRYRYLIVAPGNYGLDFLSEQYGMKDEDVVKCSNYIGQTLDMAVDMGCRGILLVGHIGKLIKVSGGIMNTHSRWADCRMELMAAAALRAGIEGTKAAALLESVTTDDALGKCTSDERVLIMNQIMNQIEEYMNYRTEGKLLTGAITFSEVYGILGKTDRADELIDRFRRERGV